MGSGQGVCPSPRRYLGPENLQHKLIQRPYHLQGSIKQPESEQCSGLGGYAAFETGVSLVFRAWGRVLFRAKTPG